MKRPDPEDLKLAAEWLRANEGEDGESETCSRVATWLDNYAMDSQVRSAARKVGCTVKYFRKYMAERSPLNQNLKDQP